MKPAFQRWAPVLTSKMAVVCVAAALLLRPGSGSAAEIGHYNGALFNIRDYFVPEPGLYAAVYNYFYTTDRLNNRKGNKVKSVTINLGDGPEVTVNVDVDVDMYAVAPPLMWVSDWKLFGAKYGALIVPTFANTSVHEVHRQDSQGSG